MKMIGFSGGSSTIEVGYMNDVLVFFYCLNHYTTSENKTEFELITDRFYKRYIPLSELNLALQLMREAQNKFKTINAKEVVWSERIDGDTRLNIEQTTLADVFSAFFLKFERAVDNAKDFYEDWDIYQAVKVVIADIPECMTYESLPLEAYNSVTGDPLWLRDARGEKPLGIKGGVGYIRENS